MYTVDASALVKGGEIQKHPAAGLFRAYLRGRKPSIVLAFHFLANDVGSLVMLQQGLRVGQPVQTRPRPRKLLEPVYLPPTWHRLQELQNIVRGTT
jgi:hypothetical protein